MPSKKRIFDIIQIGYDYDTVSRGFDFFIMGMVLLNLAIAILETFDFTIPWRPVMLTIEAFTVICFTIEYILRIWTAEYLYPRETRANAVRRYVTSFSGIVDLLSFLPFYLPVFFPAGVVAFRMLRIIRIFRLFRVNSYYDALNVIGDVVRSKKDQLLSSIFIILILMTASSLCMYSLEHDVQPNVFKNAFSGLWWPVSTLLTVGYGDIYPITLAGRIFGIIITFLGVGMVAIPTGILSAGFVEQYTRVKSLNAYSEDNDIRFVRLEMKDGHPWVGKTVRELPLPPGLIMALIQRSGHVVVPRGDTEIRPLDNLILGAESFRDDAKLNLKELTIRAEHPWNGMRIKDLDISRQSLIVMVRREGETLIPTGSLKLLEGDTILLYTKLKLGMSEAHTIEV
ncbi:MAG: ion transporter [Clostridium sp.]|nr:ion transporter [Clostridium sp.]